MKVCMCASCFHPVHMELVSRERIPPMDPRGLSGVPLYCFVLQPLSVHLDRIEGRVFALRWTDIPLQCFTENVITR